MIEISSRTREISELSALEVDMRSSLLFPKLNILIKRHENIVIICILLIAIICRGLYLWEAEKNDPFFYYLSVDPSVFHEWAEDIVSGNYFGSGVFFLSPLYPYFLALIYSITGPSILAVRIIQVLLGSASCVMLYHITRRLFCRITALTAGVLMSVYSTSIFYDTTMLVTAIQTPLNLLAVLLFLKALESLNKLLWFTSGIVLGLSVLARPNILLLAGFILPYSWIYLRATTRPRAIVFRISLFILGLFLIVLPVTVRNYVIGNDIVLVSAQAGANYYIGNGPDATGTFCIPGEISTRLASNPLRQQEAFREFAERASMRELKPSEISKFWIDRTWNYILENPREWVSLLLRKLALFVNHTELSNSRNFAVSRGFSKTLSLPLPGISFLSPLMLIGAFVGIRFFRKAFLAYAMIGVYALSLIAFFVLSHYRMPVIPFFISFASYAIVWFTSSFIKHQWLHLFAGVAGLAVAVWVVHLPLIHDEWGKHIADYNLGVCYNQLDQRELAIESYERSINLNPDFISSHYNLALNYEQPPQDLVSALEHWEEVLRLAQEQNDSTFAYRARNRISYIGKYLRRRRHMM